MTPAPLPPQVKAGWLVQLLGLLYVLFSIYIGISLVPSSAQGGDNVDPWDMAIVLLLVAYSISYLIVGQGMKDGKLWARSPGLVLLALAVLNIPIGTVIASLAFFYLAEARKSANVVP